MWFFQEKKNVQSSTEDHEIEWVSIDYLIRKCIDKIFHMMNDEIEWVFMDYLIRNKQIFSIDLDVI